MSANHENNGVLSTLIDLIEMIEVDLRAKKVRTKFYHISDICNNLLLASDHEISSELTPVQSRQQSKNNVNSGSLSSSISSNESRNHSDQSQVHDEPTTSIGFQKKINGSPKTKQTENDVKLLAAKKRSLNLKQSSNDNRSSPIILPYQVLSVDFSHLR